jgi:hypothetical protein
MFIKSFTRNQKFSFFSEDLAPMVEGILPIEIKKNRTDRVKEN